mmetsp:Transcript_28089/g.48081  ORF Transcript_28089/g.48081 Transcript_28089/m.48081 type:complete len:452 (-) Transcript_28089:67-1422(-)
MCKLSTYCENLVLSALYALGAARTLVLVLLVCTAAPAGPTAKLVHIHRRHVAVLLLAGEHHLRGRGQDLLELADHVRGQCRRKDDTEVHKETPLVEDVAVLGHALAADNLHAVVLGHLAGGHFNLQHAVVEVSDGAGETTQRLRERHVHHHHQVGALALEGFVLLLLHHDDHIAGKRAGHLVGLAGKLDFLSVAHALLNVHLQDLSVLVHLAALAGLALVLLRNRLALTLAGATRGLHLLHHTGANLAKGHLHTATTTIRASLFATLLASLAIAIRARFVTRDGQPDSLSVIHIFQRSFNAVDNILTLLRTTTATAPATTKEHRENIVGRVTLTATLALQAFHSVLIICLALLGVAQDLSGGTDFFELLDITTFIGVVLQSKFLVSLSDFTLVSIFGYTESLVQLLVVDRATRTTSATATASAAKLLKRISAAEKHCILSKKRKSLANFTK